MVRLLPLILSFFLLIKGDLSLKLHPLYRDAQHFCVRWPESRQPLQSSCCPTACPSLPGMIFLLECLGPSTTLHCHFGKRQLSTALTGPDGHSVGLVTRCDGPKEIMKMWLTERTRGKDTVVRGGERSTCMPLKLETPHTGIQSAESAVTMNDAVTPKGLIWDFTMVRNIYSKGRNRERKAPLGSASRVKDSHLCHYRFLGFSALGTTGWKCNLTNLFKGRSSHF